MNPIDQIRKALEAGPTEGPWIVMHRSSVGEYDFEVADVDHQRVVREDGMRPAVKLGTQPTDAAFIAACNPVAIAALLVSHDAAVQRAAKAETACAKFLQAINIFNDGPDESDEAMATRILSEAVTLAREIRDGHQSN